MAKVSSSDSGMNRLLECLRKAVTPAALTVLENTCKEFIDAKKDEIRKAAVIVKVCKEKKRSIDLSNARRVVKQQKVEAKEQIERDEGTKPECIA